MKNSNIQYFTWTNQGEWYEKNEDSFIVLHRTIQGYDIVLMAVADGVGGLENGDIASNTAIHELAQWFYNVSEVKHLSKDEILCFLYNIDYLIRYKSKQLSTRMGTTLSMVLCFEGVLHIYHIGDSKICLIRDKLYLISEDHTVAQRKLKKNQIPQQHEYHQLYQCLGIGKIPSIQVKQVILKENDKIFLSTDGLFHQIDTQEIWECICKQNLHTCGDTLISMARTRNERDNITCLLLKYY